jgi:hypothetical protein
MLHKRYKLGCQRINVEKILIVVFWYILPYLQCRNVCYPESEDGVVPQNSGSHSQGCMVYFSKRGVDMLGKVL